MKKYICICLSFMLFAIISYAEVYNPTDVSGIESDVSDLQIEKVGTNDTRELDWSGASDVKIPIIPANTNSATSKDYVDTEIASAAGTTNHSGLNLDDGTNPHGTLASDIPQIGANTTNITSNTSRIGTNETHRTSDGSDHSYIDQDVTSGAAPTFDGANISGLIAGEVDQVHLAVRKGSVGTITKGSPIYISGYNAGGWIEVEEADASDVNKMPALGIAEEDIDNTATVFIAIFGRLLTQDTSAWSVPDELFVGVGGGLTNAAPQGTNLIQKLAVVARSHASLGVLEAFGAGRANALPNLSQDSIWLGDSNGVPQESDLDTEIVANTTVASNSAHRGTTTGNPHSVTKSDVGLGNVEDTALSTWNGSTNIDTVGIVTGGNIDGILGNLTTHPDVSISSPSAGDLLEWNGTNWVNVASGDIVTPNAIPYLNSSTSLVAMVGTNGYVGFNGSGAPEVTTDGQYWTDVDAATVDGKEGAYLDNRTISSYTQDVAVAGQTNNFTLTNFAFNVFDVNRLILHTTNDATVSINDATLRFYGTSDHDPRYREDAWIQSRRLVSVQITNAASDATTIELQDVSDFVTAPPDGLWFPTSSSNTYNEIVSVGSDDIVIANPITVSSGDYCFVWQQMEMDYANIDATNEIYGSLIFSSPFTNNVRFVLDTK